MAPPPLDATAEARPQMADEVAAFLRDVLARHGADRDRALSTPSTTVRRRAATPASS